MSASEAKYRRPNTNKSNKFAKHFRIVQISFSALYQRIHDKVTDFVVSSIFIIVAFVFGFLCRAIS